MALAAEGCRLLVYHGGSQYIEQDVVASFVQTNLPSDRAIQVRQPQKAAVPAFPEQKTNLNLFDVRVDSGDDWEVSFYRSLADTDGVLLIGGGYSTLVAKQVPISARIPLVAIAATEAGANKVWKTISPGTDLPTRDEHAVMGKPWTEGSASACVKALRNQGKRRFNMDSRPVQTHALLAAALFVASIAIALLRYSLHFTSRCFRVIYSSSWPLVNRSVVVGGNFRGQYASFALVSLLPTALVVRRSRTYSRF